MFIPLHDDNPLKNIRFQYVTVGLIAVCAAVFAYQLSLGDRGDQAFILGFGAIPAVVFGDAALPRELAQVPAVLSLITSMFLHGGVMHLAGNMLFLWVLGDNVEDALGHNRFIVFYIIAGIAAALTHALVDPASKIPMIGASGAISGVMGAYLVLHPKARIKVLVSYFLVWLPAWVVLGGWIGLQFVSASLTTGGAGGGVAWWAHIGGFFAGMALIFPMRRGGVTLFDR
ncbi:MAG: rhomboid family intramembrane serine protease, partial [Alphaproteobacteria bacterium]|nr:rhomboid family intramembrane serine protease [Alphaproteobacteria bacterium]